MTKYMELNIENLPKILEYNGFKKSEVTAWDYAYSNSRLKLEIYWDTSDRAVSFIRSMFGYNNGYILKKHIANLERHILNALDIKLNLKLPPIEPTTFEEWWEINQNNKFLLRNDFNEHCYELIYPAKDSIHLDNWHFASVTICKFLPLDSQVSIAKAFMEAYK